MCRPENAIKNHCRTCCRVICYGLFFSLIFGAIFCGSLKASSRVTGPSCPARATFLITARRSLTKLCPRREIYPLSKASHFSKQTDDVTAEKKSALANRQAPPEIAVIGLTYAVFPSRKPLIKVRIGDSEPLLFVADTGANAVILSRWATKKLQLERLPSVKRSKVRVKGSMYDVLEKSDDFDVNLLGVNGESAIDLHDPKIYCHQDDDSGSFTSDIPGILPIAGIIGPSLLNLPFQFDFSAGTITVFPTPTSMKMSATAIRLPLRESAASPLIYSVNVTAIDGNPPLSVGKAGHEVWLELDTGSDSTDLSVDDFAISPSALKVHTKRVFLYGTSKVDTVRVASITIADKFSESDVEIGWSNKMDGSTSSPPNLLGMNFLERYRITVDPTQNALWLEKAENYAQIRERTTGNLGVYLKKRGSKYLVTTIDDSVLSLGTGIALGDEMVEIDGITIGNLADESVYSLMHRSRNTVGQLILRHPRGKSTYTVSLTRSDIYEKSH